MLLSPKLFIPMPMQRIFSLYLLTIERKLCKMTSSGDLGWGSVWMDKVFEMKNQEFKVQGTKYLLLQSFGIC